MTKPRHIEVQVFGDNHGNAVHLFERDCSLQRRHQKVIEEAPAPGMTPEMRAAMGEAAVKAALAIGYSGAGTVEFIADVSEGLRPDRFFFMEMNTRLQVEHPVTEAITGLDLVEWQLRVASGDLLPKRQDELSINGWAFEARLYAEDPARDFLPATGKLALFAPPENTRVDSGVRTGDTITPFYDPMIAKIIAHGATRDEALNRLDASLNKTRIAGLVTNRQFLSALCNLEAFRIGDVDTGLIARETATLFADEQPSTSHLRWLHSARSIFWMRQQRMIHGRACAGSGFGVRHRARPLSIIMTSATRSASRPKVTDISALLSAPSKSVPMKTGWFALLSMAVFWRRPLCASDMM